jgi:hypothetical protein
LRDYSLQVTSTDACRGCVIVLNLYVVSFEVLAVLERKIPVFCDVKRCSERGPDIPEARVTIFKISR